MTTGTLAITEGEGAAFSGHEPPTGRSEVGIKESGFWGTRANRLRKQPALPAETPTALPLIPKAPRKIVAASPSMSRVLELLEPLARAEVTVTLIGETGTGKDVLARTIHQQSGRRNGPFVVFDCGAVAANLAESELLGHERGAFTGAVGAHVGAFERAHGGTLFLDESGRDRRPSVRRADRGRHEPRLANRGQRRPLSARSVLSSGGGRRANPAAARAD
jgi:hypothetical protein